MLDAYDGLTKALVTFFGATSRAEPDRRLLSEVYMADAILARSQLSSSRIGGSLSKHGFMKVRPRSSHGVTKKANNGAQLLSSAHGEPRVDESMSIICQSIASRSEF